MQLTFHGLTFETEKQTLLCNGMQLGEINLCGNNKNNHLGGKCVGQSEAPTLHYQEHTLENDCLRLVQTNGQLEVVTVLEGFADTNALRVHTEVTNRSGEPVVLEQVPSFVLGLSVPRSDTENAYLYRYFQSHHGECQVRRSSLYELGLSDLCTTSQLRIGQSNVGSWSTKESLPQGILEYSGRYIMFQIESNNSWYYELSDLNKQLYLFLCGPSSMYGNWRKKLAPGDTYVSKYAALAAGSSLDGVVGEMTRYRRHIRGQCAQDNTLPVIFNEYMHLSWDNPTEAGVRTYAPRVREAGAEYYVIDCGWHDEVPANVVYDFVGCWQESKTRFPSGLRRTTDYIRSLGMKPGLWIEPEIVGIKCEKMLDYYGEDCFLTRNGKRVCTMGRYFLDFRNAKVTGYLTETVRRMVEDYGAAYIKFDYNEDVGIGCDRAADSMGEGLEQCAAAYLRWVEDIRRRFPEVLFETCSSGGMRMDYETLSRFSIVSTSDQVDYRKYPYIAANVLSAVLPEQAAVWSYPVGTDTVPNQPFCATAEWVSGHVTQEQVIMNMINAFLGRIHLASHIELLPEDCFALVQEGVAYYESLSEAKKTALPVFPLGFAEPRKRTVAGGFTSGGRLYLAVWNLGGERDVRIDLHGQYSTAKCAYPQCNTLPFRLDNGSLNISFDQDVQARFFELQ